MFNLAVSYETGFGLRKNTSKAFDWYVAAAGAGDSQAVDEVVRHLYWGIGFKRHRKLAFLIQDIASKP
jgi:TPR repeat protein